MDSPISACIGAECLSYQLDRVQSVLTSSSGCSSRRATDTGADFEMAEVTEDVQPPDSGPDSGPDAAWGHLNGDVLQIVFQALRCQDAITASGVCKHWRAVAVQVRSLSRVVLFSARCLCHPLIVRTLMRKAVSEHCSCTLYTGICGI